MTLISAHVTSRGLPQPDALDADVRQRGARREQFYTGIVRCHVVMARSHRRRHDGRHVHVRIETGPQASTERDLGTHQCAAP